MKKSVVMIFTGVFLSTTVTTAVAKKPVPPSTVIDYDITGFICPATVPSAELVELDVLVTNVDSSDPGVVLQAREEDAW